MTGPDTPRPPRSKTLRLWLIIGSVAAVLAVIPAAMMGMMSVMATDSGGSSAIYVFIWTALTFPIAIVLGPVLGWIAWLLRRERLAWIVLFAPLAWAVVLVLILAFAPG